MIQLIFKTKHLPILKLKVDLPKKLVTPLKVYDKIAASIVLKPADRNYAGLEARLQYYMVDKQPLPKLLEHIKVHGFYVPNQHNLDVDLIELVEVNDEDA